MAIPNNRPSPSENYAALTERVQSLTDDMHTLRSDVQDMRGTMASAAAVREISGKLEALGSRLEERNKTQWPTLISGGGFILAIMVAIGTLAYRPIEATQARHEQILDTIERRYVGDLKDRIRFLEQRQP